MRPSYRTVTTANPHRTARPRIPGGRFADGASVPAFGAIMRDTGRRAWTGCRPHHVASARESALLTPRLSTFGVARSPCTKTATPRARPVDQCARRLGHRIALSLRSRRVGAAPMPHPNHQASLPNMRRSGSRTWRWVRRRGTARNGPPGVRRSPYAHHRGSDHGEPEADGGRAVHSSTSNTSGDRRRDGRRRVDR